MVTDARLSFWRWSMPILPISDGSMRTSLIRTEQPYLSTTIGLFQPGGDASGGGNRRERLIKRLVRNAEENIDLVAKRVKQRFG